MNKPHIKLALAFLAGVALCLSGYALTQSPVFNIFEPPASGSIMVSNASYNPRAGTYSDIAGLFTGCSGSFSVPDVLNGTCIAPGGTIASPSGTIGLSVVTGATGNYMDAGSAPALSQAIVPTWTGVHTFSVAPVFSAGTTYANNEPLQGKTSGGTTYTALIPYDSSNNTDLFNYDAEPINLRVSATAGGTPACGLSVVTETSTYSQVEVCDSAGNLWAAGYRDVPEETSNCSSGTCTLDLAELGKWVIIGAGGGTVTWPSGTFSDGATITLRVCCGSATTITVGSGLTLIWANGTENTGNRSVVDGEITLHQEGTTTVFISGTGIS